MSHQHAVKISEGIEGGNEGGGGGGGGRERERERGRGEGGREIDVWLLNTDILCKVLHSLFYSVGVHLAPFVTC